MYCCLLWFTCNSTASNIKKIKSSYNSVLRRLVCMPYIASEMFVSCGIPFFYELLRKCIFDFSERINKNINSIIEACLSPK